MRRFIVIFLIIAFIVAIAIGVYLGYQKSKKVISPVGPGGNLPVGPTGQREGAGEQKGEVGSNVQESYVQEQKKKLSILTTEPVVDYWVTVPKSTSTPSQIFYLNQKGEVVEVIEPGKGNVVAKSNFGVPVRSLQNIDGSKVIVLFDSGSLAVFDTASKVWQQLDSSILSFDFSPDGKSIVYIKPNGSQNSIYIQNLSLTKKNLTLVSTLNIQDFLVFWPSANVIVIVSKPAYKFYGQAWYFDLKKGTLNSLGIGKALEYVFSKKSNYGLEFSSAQADKVNVSVIDYSGKKLADLPFSTLASKCSFAYDDNSSYCAIPFIYTGQIFVLPDDYFKKAVFTNDAIYKIDFKSYELNEIMTSKAASIDVSKLKAARSMLLFVNRFDGLLYKFDMD